MAGSQFRKPVHNSCHSRKVVVFEQIDLIETNWNEERKIIIYFSTAHGTYTEQIKRLIKFLPLESFCQLTRSITNINLLNLDAFGSNLKFNSIWLLYSPGKAIIFLCDTSSFPDLEETFVEGEITLGAGPESKQFSCHVTI